MKYYVHAGKKNWVPIWMLAQKKYDYLSLVHEFWKDIVKNIFQIETIFEE